MEKENIDKMVDKFLSWKLPKDFSPDGGISFAMTYLGYKEGVHVRIDRNVEDHSWPIGTNLLDAKQARGMIEYILSDVDV